MQEVLKHLDAISPQSRFMTHGHELFQGGSDSHWGHGECVPPWQPGDAEPGGQHHSTHWLCPLRYRQWLHWACHTAASGGLVHLPFQLPQPIEFTIWKISRKDSFVTFALFIHSLLVQEFYELLIELQKRLTKAIKSVGRIEHGVWRSFQRQFFYKDIACTNV